MKIKKLTVKNIGIVVDEKIIFDKPLNLFYGEIRQGKSTLAINSIKLLFGGSFPDDLIRHGEKEASVALEFDNAMLQRRFYINKKGILIAKPIEFTIDNKKPDGGPIEAIKKLVNPFLLDQDFLIKKTELERQRYFIELFGVDTDALDAEYKRLEAEAKDLRVEIKAFGEIDTTEVTKPDVDKLVAEKQRIDAENSSMKTGYENEVFEERQTTAKYNMAVYEHNNNIAKAKEKIDYCESEIYNYQTTVDELEVQIAHLKAKIYERKAMQTSLSQWLDDPKNMNEQTKLEVQIPEPDYLPTSDLEEQISNAKANAIRYDQYLGALERQAEKDQAKETLRSKEHRQREIKAQKAAKLREVSDNSGVPDLVFDDDGNLTYQNTAAGMLSNSQLMELSSELSKLYPEGLGIELIDRAESLGRSIFNYVQRAKDEEKTILATIVGEKPANVPESIGVFVVEQGRVVKESKEEEKTEEFADI